MCGRTSRPCIGAIWLGRRSVKREGGSARGADFSRRIAGVAPFPVTAFTRLWSNAAGDLPAHRSDGRALARSRFRRNCEPQGAPILGVTRDGGDRAVRRCVAAGVVHVIRRKQRVASWRLRHRHHHDEASGRMTAQLMLSSNRADRVPATDEDRAAAYRRYLGYWGPFTVDTATGVVVHHVEGSSNPSWVGNQQIRHFDFAADGNRLTLSVKSGDRVTSTLVWERLR